MAYAVVHFELDSNWLEHSQHSHVFHIVRLFAIEKFVQNAKQDVIKRSSILFNIETKFMFDLFSIT
jgi:hypothetical protein